MINTLQNSPERIPSKWGNKLKKAVALAIALTLSGEPTEAKTYEKQEFPTEMVANIPEYAPMTENIEQATVPNYINQARNWVRKYYPQYEEYFRPIFKRINNLWENNIKLINTKINENFLIFEDEIKSEKDKITTTLIVLEKIIWTNSFYKSKEIEKIDPNEWYDIREGIATEIIWEINIKLSQKLKENKEKLEATNSRKEELNKQIAEINNLNNKLRSIGNNNTDNERILNEVEIFFEKVDSQRIRESKAMQNFIESYLNINKRIGRTPKKWWKKIYEEYKKIKNNQ